jgi:hypothetical protein
VIPPAAAPGSVAAAPANYPGAGGQSGPKKETARISILPERTAPAPAAVKMSKTQPLLATPENRTPNASVAVAKAPAAAATSARSLGDVADLLDAVPLPVCWTIFGISTVTLLIQIWNYLGS